MRRVGGWLVELSREGAKGGHAVAQLGWFAGDPNRGDADVYEYLYSVKGEAFGRGYRGADLSVQLQHLCLDSEAL
jgi:hypothetical protein